MPPNASMVWLPIVLFMQIPVQEDTTWLHHCYLGSLLVAIV